MNGNKPPSGNRFWTSGSGEETMKHNIRLAGVVAVAMTAVGLFANISVAAGGDHQGGDHQDVAVLDEVVSSAPVIEVVLSTPAADATDGVRGE